MDNHWLIQGIVSAWFKTSIIFFFLSHLVSVLLLALSFFSVRARDKSSRLFDSLKRKYSAFSPPISIIAPAYNEHRSIVQSVRSFLSLSYPKFEVIVVNDASTDNTVDLMKEAFALQPTKLVYDGKLTDSPIKAVYRSATDERLIVIDKATNSGNKVGPNNVGIGFAQYDLVCILDADSILEEDALEKVVHPFVMEPEKMLAVGGTVRVVNGCVVRNGRVVHARLPKNFWSLIQVVEYLRAFLYGRVGWNVLNSVLIVSGAFGLFNKKMLEAIGGYRLGAVGEDMDMVVRLHRYFSRNRRRYRIAFVPDPVCWTEVPSDRASLRRQRDRWQRGLADVLISNLGMLFNWRYGILAFLTLPYYWCVELLGPLFAMLVYVSLPVAAYFGMVSGETIVIFVIVAFFNGVLLSIAAVLIEEYCYPRYTRLRDVLLLFMVGVLENFGYRQLHTAWRLQGLINYFRGHKSWGQMNRSGFGHHP